MGNRGGSGCTGWILGAPIGLAVLSFFCISTFLVFGFDIARQKLSGFGLGWGDSAVKDWMMGTPQATYDEREAYGGKDGVPIDSDNPGEPGEEENLPGVDIVNLGSIAYDGYVGPEKFVCSPLAPDASFSYISDCFGTSRPVGCNNPNGCYHPGMDIGVGHTPIITPMSGKVVFAGILAGGWGYSILIENNGKQVLLTHATSLMYKGNEVKPENIVGKIVEAGDVVMISGGDNGDQRDGRSTGAHLHFEVRECYKNYAGTMSCGQAKDPMKVFLAGQKSACNWYQQVTSPNSNTSCTKK